MAQHPKGKPRPKKAKSATTDTDKEQSERFKKIARELGVDESGGAFEDALREILPSKIHKGNAGR